MKRKSTSCTHKNIYVPTQTQAHTHTIAHKDIDNADIGPTKLERFISFWSYPITPLITAGHQTILAYTCSTF